MRGEERRTVVANVQHKLHATLHWKSIDTVYFYRIFFKNVLCKSGPWICVSILAIVKGMQQAQMVPPQLHPHWF